MKITRGTIQTAQKLVVFGPEGIGKTTFASQAPEPLFIDTEGSTKHLDVARLDTPLSWQMLKEQVTWVIRNKPCKTLVIDSADWAETLAAEHLIKAEHWTSIETPGYGKGYTVLAEEWGRLLNLLSEVVESGIHVILTAHAQMRKFEAPEAAGAYDRWELKMSKKSAAMTKEWADILLFANYKVLVYTDGQSKTKRAVGGERVMYTTHNPAYDAKNRMGLPAEMPLAFSGIAHVFEDEQPETIAPQVKEEEPPAQVEPAPAAEPPVTPAELPPSSPSLPKALSELLAAGPYTIEQLQRAVGPQGNGGLGYMPGDMSALDYPQDFVDYMISTWPEISGQMDNLGPFDLAGATDQGNDLPFTF